MGSLTTMVNGFSTAFPSRTFQVLRIPVDGGQFEFIQLHRVWGGGQPVQANVDHVPDLRPYWGVFGWNPRNIARFYIGNHDNPTVNGTYLVFWSTGLHMEVNQHKTRFMGGLLMDFRGDVFIAQLGDPETDEDEHTVYRSISSDNSMFVAWFLMLASANIGWQTGYRGVWSWTLPGPTSPFYVRLVC